MILCIVNDERLTAETMRDNIPWEKYGITEVYAAFDAKEAKEYIKQYAIDILLCDIEMPGENGLELLYWVREQGYGIECIFLTCHASFVYAQEAITLGCQDYILMPAKDEEIGQAVYKVVQRILKSKEEKRFQELGRRAAQDKVEQVVEIHGGKQSPEEIVAEIERYVRDNLGNADFTINEIAEKMYLHPVYLNRVFKKKKGTSIGQYIISERMELAATLLQEGRISAYVVSEQVGYKSYSNFNLTFKKTFNCTPSQFGKQEK